MVSMSKIKIKKDEKSKWTDAIEIVVHNYDAIQIFIDYDGRVIDEYYDEKRITNTNPVFLK